MHVHQIAEALKVSPYNNSDCLPWAQKRRENLFGTKLQKRGKVLAENNAVFHYDYHQVRESFFFTKICFCIKLYMCPHKQKNRKIFFQHLLFHHLRGFYYLTSVIARSVLRCKTLRAIKFPSSVMRSSWLQLHLHTTTDRIPPFLQL